MHVLFVTKYDMACISLHMNLYCSIELLLNICSWSFMVTEELKIIQEMEENINFVTSRKYDEEDR
jgi:hypothetical protein